MAQVDQVLGGQSAALGVIGENGIDLDAWHLAVYYDQGHPPPPQVIDQFRTDAGSHEENAGHTFFDKDIGISALFL